MDDIMQQIRASYSSLPNAKKTVASFFLILYFYPECADLSALPDNWQDTVVGIAGQDPKVYASAENLARRLPALLERIGQSIQEALRTL